MFARAVSLRRAISNLVENALQYGGNVRLAIRQEDGATLICVDDDGPGIPVDKIGSVLQPFVRLDEGRARNTRGMGLANETRLYQALNQARMTHVTEGTNEIQKRQIAQNIFKGRVDLSFS